MSSETYHEPLELLPEPTRDLHRAIVSLMEELEAVDWYQQRAQATQDLALRAVLEHNRDEEIEHAMMTLEWLRRNNAKFDENIRTYLLTTAPITQVEEADTGKGGGDAATSDGASSVAHSATALASNGTSDGSLGVGSLKGG